jgi:hypothetical protein
MLSHQIWSGSLLSVHAGSMFVSDTCLAVVTTAALQKDEWDRFDVHKLFLASNGKPLTAITKATLQELGLMSLINHAQLRRFLRKLEKLYLKNEYHSSTHAADVVHAVYVIIKQVRHCTFDSVLCGNAAAASQRPKCALHAMR